AAAGNGADGPLDRARVVRGPSAPTGKIDRWHRARQSGGIRRPHMTTSTKTASFVPLARLPRAPASDFKMLGWPGVMNTLRANGTLLVTNHDGPEAVIIPVAEYDA